MNLSNPHKFILEIILFSTYMLFAMLWKTGDFLIASYGYDPMQLAFMTNAISIAKIIGCALTMFVISKYGNRKTFFYSTLLMTVGLLISFTDVFPLVFSIRFILGLGGALVLVTINPIVAKVFSKDELPYVNGANAVAFNTGLTITLFAAASIKADPKFYIIAMSLILLICAISWHFISSQIEDDNQKAEQQRRDDAAAYTLKDGLKEHFNWTFPIAYSGLLSFYLVSFTFMDPASVKYVMFAGIIGSIVGTIMVKNMANKLAFVRVTALLQLLCAIGFLLTYTNEVMVIVMGLALGFFIFVPMPAFVTLAYMRKDITPHKVSVTFSIFWSLSYLVSIFTVQGFGYLKTLNGNNLTQPFIYILCIEAIFFIGTQFLLKKTDFES